MKKQIGNVVVVSDLHCGCQLGLCPLSGAMLDEGGEYKPNLLQEAIWQRWEEFWDKWVPKFCRDEPYHLVINGEAIDGVHHNSVTQFSHNLVDQKRLAMRILQPLARQCEGDVYFIRGTEAHSGQSSQVDEEIAEQLGAVPNERGQYARWQLWKRLGFALVNVAHHIGTTGSMAYETSALQKELEQIFADSARWHDEIPDVVVRSHRHRNVETRLMIEKNGRPGFATTCVTAGWQMKTPFAQRVAGSRRARAQIGGTVVRCGDEDVYTRHKIWPVERPKVEA